MPRRARPRLTMLEDRATPAVFTVTTPTDAGPGSLREAIGFANDEANYPGFDSIQFAPDLFGQTIALSTAADTSLGNSALLVTSEVFIDGFAGYPGSGPGITIARERGVPDLRLFFVSPAGKLTLDGLTVAGGLARGGDGQAGGGGGYSYGSYYRYYWYGGYHDPNYSGGGGAGVGGGVYNRGTLIVSRSLFADNQAVGGQGGTGTSYQTYGAGGGGNAVGFGRGGYGGSGAYHPYYYWYWGYGGSDTPAGPGSVGGFGGGGGSGNPGAAGGFGGGTGSNTYSDSAGGGAGLGGAVFNHGGTVAVLNSTFADNMAFGGGATPNAGSGLGGGVFNLNGTVTVANSTFSGNHGGAVYVVAHDASGGVGNANPSTLLLANSILANSTNGRDLTVSQLPGSGGATVTGAAGNLVETSTYSGGTAPWYWDSRDPQLLPLADNGGLTRTMALPAASPARDAGWWVWAPAGGDQRGNEFSRVVGREVDLGAFEGPVLRPLAVTAATPTGGEATVTLLDPTTGQPLRSFVPFPGFGGTVNVTVGDANGDGYGDLVVGAGAGGGPHVKLFDGISGRELLSFYAYDPTFTGGVDVAAGEGLIVTGAGAGGGPHVKTFDGRTGAERLSFYAYDPLFAGGVSVGVAGGRIVTGAGPGGSPHVKAFDSRTGVELGGFYAYDPWFTGGVNVSAGPAYSYYSGTYQYYYGTYLVTAPSEGGGPFVRVFRWDYGPTGDEVWRGMAYDPAFDGGVSVAMGNDGVVYTGAGPGGGPHVRGIRSSDGKEVLSLYAFDPGFLGGVNVG